MSPIFSLRRHRSILKKPAAAALIVAMVFVQGPAGDARDRQTSETLVAGQALSATHAYWFGRKLLPTLPTISGWQQWTHVTAPFSLGHEVELFLRWLRSPVSPTTPILSLAGVPGHFSAGIPADREDLFPVQSHDDQPVRELQSQFPQITSLIDRLYPQHNNPRMLDDFNNWKRAYAWLWTYRLHSFGSVSVAAFLNSPEFVEQLDNLNPQTFIRLLSHLTQTQRMYDLNDLVKGKMSSDWLLEGLLPNGPLRKKFNTEVSLGLDLPQQSRDWYAESIALMASTQEAVKNGEAPDARLAAKLLQRYYRLSDPDSLTSDIFYAMNPTESEAFKKLIQFLMKGAAGDFEQLKHSNWPKKARMEAVYAEHQTKLTNDRAALPQMNADQTLEFWLEQLAQGEGPLYNAGAQIDAWTVENPPHSSWKALFGHDPLPSDGPLQWESNKVLTFSGNPRRPITLEDLRIAGSKTDRIWPPIILATLKQHGWDTPEALMALAVAQPAGLYPKERVLAEKLGETIFITTKGEPYAGDKKFDRDTFLRVLQIFTLKSEQELRDRTSAVRAKTFSVDTPHGLVDLVDSLASPDTAERLHARSWVSGIKDPALRDDVIQTVFLGLFHDLQSADPIETANARREFIQVFEPKRLAADAFKALDLKHDPDTDRAATEGLLFMSEEDLYQHERLSELLWHANAQIQARAHEVLEGEGAIAQHVARYQNFIHDTLLPEALGHRPSPRTAVADHSVLRKLQGLMTGARNRMRTGVAHVGVRHQLRRYLRDLKKGRPTAVSAAVQRLYDQSAAFYESIPQHLEGDALVNFLRNPFGVTDTPLGDVYCSVADRFPKHLDFFRRRIQEPLLQQRVRQRYEKIKTWSGALGFLTNHLSSDLSRAAEIATTLSAPALLRLAAEVAENLLHDKPVAPVLQKIKDDVLDTTPALGLNPGQGHYVETVGDRALKDVNTLPETPVEQFAGYAQAHGKLDPRHATKTVSPNQDYVLRNESERKKVGALIGKPTLESWLRWKGMDDERFAKAVDLMDSVKSVFNRKYKKPYDTRGLDPAAAAEGLREARQSALEGLEDANKNAVASSKKSKALEEKRKAPANDVAQRRKILDDLQNTQTLYQVALDQARKQKEQMTGTHYSQAGFETEKEELAQQGLADLRDPIKDAKRRLGEAESALAPVDKELGETRAALKAEKIEARAKTKEASAAANRLAREFARGHVTGKRPSFTPTLDEIAAMKKSHVGKYVKTLALAGTGAVQVYDEFADSLGQSLRKDKLPKNPSAELLALARTGPEAYFAAYRTRLEKRDIAEKKAAQLLQQSYPAEVLALLLAPAPSNPRRSATIDRLLSFLAHEVDGVSPDTYERIDRLAEQAIADRTYVLNTPLWTLGQMMAWSHFGNVTETDRTPKPDIGWLEDVTAELSTRSPLWKGPLDRVLEQDTATPLDWFEAYNLDQVQREDFNTVHEHFSKPARHRKQPLDSAS